MQPHLVDEPDDRQRRRHRPGPKSTGTDRLAVVLIPADSPGIERAPFWQTTVLAAAESDQVTLTDGLSPKR